MLREIVIPTSEFYNIQIPKEYINQEVEILVLPFLYAKKQIIKDSKNDDIFSKTAGVLGSKDIDPIKWQEEMRSDRKI